MVSRLTHTQLLRFAGLFTWAMVGAPLLYAWVQGVDELSSTFPVHLTWWAAAYFGFGATYWALTRALGVRRTRWFDTLLLLMLTISAVAVSYFTSTGLGSVLLMVMAGVLPWLLSVPSGIAWLILGHLAVIPVFVRGLDLPLVEAVMQSLLYAGFSSFVFATGLVAKQQAQAREEQRRLNAELRATRALLAESSRMSERLRISRELHDLLGHHLTALSLNLEVAGHLTEGKAQEHVKQSHTLAKLLLTDVREAVSEMREDGAIELGAAIRTLAEGVPALDIHLDLPEPFLIEDSERAQILLRCAQEIITNAVRHAGGSTLSLRFIREPKQLRIEARDDGQGVDLLEPGNGLRGMRERLAHCGGQVEIKTGRGEGFALDIRLPLESSP